MSYIGRFAPSPTGLLHFGSLLAALASYLDARARQGRWLLRIEDLDPPREHPGARIVIPQTLERFGLHWDGPISYQSDRLHHYQQALEQLLEQQSAYRCDCSRSAIQKRTGSNLYDRYCLLQPPHEQQQCAIRVHVDSRSLAFDDQIQGPQQYRLDQDSGDFVIRRKDGLFAYQLAVVVDDYLQGISHVVRGCDLLDETPKQIRLQRLLGYPQPHYCHIPVASNAAGQKLSKQTFAAPLDDQQPVPQLLAALRFLGQRPDSTLTDARAEELLSWAVENWRPEQIPRRPSIHWQG
ncbi:tRNA glutamyl-Q(34) synthetase GluQRS [Marinobacterium arenosum]|uniref:tRNA glutamyl-Q(34) synthetase GluQRS n=1 Tax=Marinobacterium arenosum TaxID=2862496 RepID=UPI001C95AD75|nr:tRNA glutamyl-Q(34) synthetase GluQRS [Marinobacterium arenosum]MBY4678290.1 tRNA glutamyl-Q(34) synthetase GluQRS [Marinobacterium arenosum]